jgi:hypothetical protein
MPLEEIPTYRDAPTMIAIGKDPDYVGIGPSQTLRYAQGSARDDNAALFKKE